MCLGKFPFALVPLSYIAEIQGETAIELGTHGVLVASGVVKAKDPADALQDLLEGTLSYR
jgi:pyridoxal biosynthesis lyase PdxS